MKDTTLRRTEAKIGSQLGSRLAAYVAGAGAAGVSLLALTQATEAKVIYTNTYAKLGPGGYSLDLNHDGTVDAILAGRASCIRGFSRSSLCYSQSQIGASVIGNHLSFFGRVVALRAGEQIGPSDQFISYGNIVALSWKRTPSQYMSAEWKGSFANGGHGARDRYIGIKFKIGGQTHYGWARVSVSIPDPKALKHTTILTGYAYETEPNKPISTGVTSGPEKLISEMSLDSQFPPPASLGLLSRGAEGLQAWRRRDNGAEI